MLKNIIDKYKSLPVQMKASFWFLICATFQRGFSIVTAPIFTRIMSTAEYGEYNVFNSWYSIISIVVTLNLFYGVYMQGLVKFEEDRAKYISSLQGLTLLLSVIWTVIYVLLNDIWNKLFQLTTIQMVLMLITIWITAVYNFWAGEQRTEYKYAQLVAFTMLATIIKPIISVALMMNSEDKVTARIAGSVVIDVLFYLIFFFKQIKRGKVLFCNKYWKHALRFNIPLVPHYLSQIVLSSSDRIMIKNMVGSSEAGIYSLAYSVSTIMSLFNTALMQTIEPWLFRKIKDNETEDIKKVAYPSFAMVGLLNIFLIAFAPEVVSFFAPSEYSDAVKLIPPVAMSVYYIYIYSFFATFEFYFEKTKYISLATMIGAVFNIISNFICISIFGYGAASYTTLVCYILFAILHYCFMRKICNEFLPNKKIYDLRIILLITIIFMGIGFLFGCTYSINILRYSMIIVCIVIVALKRKMIIRLIKDIIRNKKG